MEQAGTYTEEREARPGTHSQSHAPGRFPYSSCLIPRDFVSSSPPFVSPVKQTCLVSLLQLCSSLTSLSSFPNSYFRSPAVLQLAINRLTSPTAIPLAQLVCSCQHLPSVLLLVRPRAQKKALNLLFSLVCRTRTHIPRATSTTQDCSSVHWCTVSTTTISTATYICNTQTRCTCLLVFHGFTSPQLGQSKLRPRHPSGQYF